MARTWIPFRRLASAHRSVGAYGWCLRTRFGLRNDAMVDAGDPNPAAFRPD